ncbi:S-layer homology domain-containing protein [Paenibacillus rhizophilus]|uniref:S-layer homology domain-containing protein n=1 Tax=Paenibacillus rhizophilus TaxID=1850366 RepID=A0A3N9Q4X4_9BACL|nr:S-layer homology domain-containing protein [Paenibacillus rhizophilus]RQW12566.1 S-layer homology domain-containing protein [Paenibacillus rhizophilus]
MRPQLHRIILFLFLPFFLIAQSFPVSARAAESDLLDKYYPSDIEGHWAYEAIDNFVNANLLGGYADAEGTISIKPNNNITRAEFVTILVNAAGLTSSQSGKTFTDVKAGKWYADPIRIASSLGIVGGITNTEFGPDRPITRGEIAVMVVNAFSSSVQFDGQPKAFTDVPQYYAKTAIQKASQAGIVTGMTQTEFKPFNRATRAQAVVMLERSLKLQQGNLPTDQDLIDVAAKADKEETQLMVNKKYADLERIFLKYYTGYQFAYNMSSLAEINQMAAVGGKIDIEVVKAPTFLVTERSDRLAVLDSVYGEIKMKISNGANTYEDTIKTDGQYLLKKMSDNSWKIYAILTN